MEGFNSATIIALIVFAVMFALAIKRSSKGFKGCDGCKDKDCANCTRVNDLQRMLNEGERCEREEVERLGIEEEYQKIHKEIDDAKKGQ